MASVVRGVLTLLVGVYVCLAATGEFYHKKFEYKYSFKGPYLAQKDGSVPFWEYGGSTIASEESVRITPSLKSKKGYIWTKNQTNFDWWLVEFVFRVTGRGRVGADGLAFWYTETKGLEGPVFGSSDQWKGLALFFDSFDNDNKNNNPYIMAMINDGTRMFDHPNDGASQQLAGCLRDYRNKPFPLVAKVEYYKNTLTVLFRNGMTNNEQDFELCLRAENVYLPKYGHFGISAATGGLADDHDVLKLLTYSLVSPDSQPSSVLPIGESEKEKLQREFEEYRSKLEKQKEDFRREHPNEARERDRDENPEEWYESDQQRELHQIFTGQSQMFSLLKELHRKMDEIVGRQERTLSLITTVQQVQQPIQGQVPPVQGQPLLVDTIRRHEVDAVLANQHEIVGTAREIKAFVTEIHQKANTILSSQSKPGSAAIGYDFHGLANELKDGLNVVKRDLSSIQNRNTASCPEQPMPSCVSTTVFLVFVAIQLIVIFGYFVYRDSKEAQAKKFY